MAILVLFGDRPRFFFVITLLLILTTGCLCDKSYRLFSKGYSYPYARDGDYPFLRTAYYYTDVLVYSLPITTSR